MKKYIIFVFIILFFISLLLSCEPIDQKEMEKIILKQKIINHINKTKDIIKENIRFFRNKDNSDELNKVEEYLENPEPYLTNLANSEKGYEGLDLINSTYENNLDVEQMGVKVKAFDENAYDEYQKLISDENIKKATSSKNAFSKSYNGYWFDGFKFDCSFAGIIASKAILVGLKIKATLLPPPPKPPQVLYPYIYYPTVAAGFIIFTQQVELIKKFMTGWNGFYNHASICIDVEAGAAAGLTVLGMPELPTMMTGYWLLQIGVSWPILPK